jgi:glutaredoxin
MAKEYFQQNNIAFEEKDVSTDVEARNEMIEKSGQLGVPVIDIDGKITVGFDKSHINELLNIK